MKLAVTPLQVSRAMPLSNARQGLVRRLKTLAVLSAFATFSATAQAPGDVRIALVIGNSAYAGPMALPNPSNDAKAMSETLKGLGFEVFELRDGSREQMAAAIARTQGALKGKQGVGMLYYAGHGLQSDSRNYMVPVDAKIARASDVAGQTLDVGTVIEAFKTAGNRMNIVVLDACRDNPFGGITTGKGLAPLDAPSGTFLAYATAPGNVAADGDEKSGNGLYTQYLLQELKKPQARIEDVFKRVRFAVRKASGGKQIPWESTSLEDDFQFNDGRIVAVARPTGVELAAEFNREKADWNRIKDSKNADDFYAFLQKFPNGTLTEAALTRLNEINKPELIVQGAGADGSDKPYTRNAFRLGDVFEMAVVDKKMREVRTVVKATDDEVLITTDTIINGELLKMPKPVVQQFNNKGAMVNNGHGRFSPPQDVYPAEQLAVGKNWKYAYDFIAPMFGSVPSGSRMGAMRVVGRDMVKVPAGTFAAFRVEHLMYDARRPDAPETSCTTWLTSELPVPIKHVCKMDVPGIPKGAWDYTQELTKVTRGS
jgi:hypothetical protein